MSPRSLVRRSVAAVAGTAVAAGGLLAFSPAPAAQAADPTAQNAGLAWLGKQFDGANLIAGDVTSTIEYALSATALGATPDARAKLGVDAALESYVEKGDQNVAMAAIFYETVGADPTDTPAGNLIVKLEAAIDDTTGELTTYPYTYGQALAVQALRGSEAATETDKAYDFLVGKQRCADGGFGWGATDDPATCTSSSDETSLGIRAISGMAGSEDVVASASAWLAGQHRNGAFGYISWVAPYDFVESANSTGLAAEALRLAGRTEAAASAAAWVQRHQTVGTACDGKLSVEKGAIPADVSYVSEGRTFGITAETRSSWTLATAQAVRALPSATSAAGAPSLSVPAFVHVSDLFDVRASGLAPSGNACVTLGGSSAWVQGGSASLKAPAGTGRHLVTLTTIGGSVTATVHALAATTLKVKAPSTVKAKKKATIKVKRLAAGESVTVKIGKKKATGTANAQGVATVKVKVTKRGKAKVKVKGQFPDRRGKATIRVV
ncbi:hypothetical protein ACJ5H2_15220 [Nocardioides sp. R1-1]|uniref:hypothetical protein n=1 Tax=Nocardioides sp. R1-1 TaxID=3383502 RepID=UPI0038D069B3